MNLNPNFPTWKTISIGTYKNVSDLKKSILDAGYKIGTWADDVLESPHFTLESSEKKIDLVRVTPADLGFPDGTYRSDIYKRALQIGLKLCSLEIGPQLRVQYHDQPRLESLQIGMEPQADSDGHKSEFRIVHGADDYIWLVGDHKHPDDFWSGEEYFIFVK